MPNLAPAPSRKLSQPGVLIKQRKNPDAALAVLPYYAATVLALTLAMHLAIIFNPLYTLPIQAVGCGVVALLLALYAVIFGKGLDRLRFGGLTAHALTYALLIGGNLAHFGLAAGAVTPEEQPLLLASWAPVTIAMGGFWGLGLIIHALAVIFSRGYEANGFLGGRPHGA